MSVFGRVSTIIVNWDIQRLKLGSTHRVLKNRASSHRQKKKRIHDVLSNFRCLVYMGFTISGDTISHKRKYNPLYNPKEPVIFASMLKKPSSMAESRLTHNHSHGSSGVLQCWTIIEELTPGQILLDPQRKKNCPSMLPSQKDTTLPNRIISKSFLVFWKYIPFFPFHGLLNDKYLDVFQPPG